MKVLVVSDLHLDQHADGGKSLLADLVTDVDVAIVAGDLTEGPQLFDALRDVSEMFQQLVFVPGNHDWFHASREKMASIRTRVERELPNVSWLDRDIVEIGGQRFVGTTLWFKDSAHAQRWQKNMPDFSLIEGFRDWYGAEFELNRAFLESNVGPGDVVITHHLPSRQSIADQWVNSPLNCYFVGNVEEVVKNQGARYWIHGHTHNSCDYMCGRTRVICNPFGYPGAPNREFKERLMVGA